MEELYSLAPEALQERLLGAVGTGTWPPVHDAVALAVEKHAGQTRKDGEPFVSHPLRVALILLELGGLNDANLLCAALLHDIVEDTEVSVADLQQQFGGKVGDMVRSVTLPPRAEGQTAHAQIVSHFQTLAWEGRDTQILRSADRLDNIRTIDGAVSAERKAEYLQETREGLLPLTLACNTAIYHALNDALEQAGCAAT